MNRPANFLITVLWLLLPFAAGLFGSQFRPGDWYAQLTKPAWTPPGWIFGPVWTALYLMMGIAAALVWRSAGRRTLALSLFGIQLLLNALWSWFFFGLKNPALALADILLLWIAIAATMVAFWKVRPVAGALFVPYLLWVSFAAALNFTIWRLNPAG